MIFWVFFLFTLAASHFTIAKAALQYGQPIFFVAARMIVSGIILLGFLINRKRFPSIEKSHYIDFASIILFHIYLAFVLDMIALNYMVSSKGALIFNLSPFVTALFSYFIFHEKMTFNKYIGFFIGILGLLPEILAPAPQENLIQNSSFISWPEILMIGSVITSVYGWVTFRKLIRKGYSPLQINGIGMLGGGILALVTSLIFEWQFWQPLPISNYVQFCWLTGLIIIMANFLFYNLYGWLLKQYTATFLAFAGFITPLITALFGWIFLGETVHWQFFFSVFIVSIGLSIFYFEELKQGYIIKQR